ncbi:MAG: toll/interleukin-1 receptor domain-containing protein, partial [Clostridia bacterium]
AALEHADVVQRSIYQQEAAAIEALQKDILAISSKEELFDVFICYKETDANGRRTPDSVLANDLYHELTNEGFKVFFSRITLENMLGSAYEPYIFAALNSAKVMVVIGTKPEYFNAIWVKNEWSRFLGLIKGGAKKTLVPAYKDIDPYDLPEEFGHLQAQDMGKLGFMQDLIRGIKKLAQKEEEAKADTVAAPAQSTADINTEALLQRVFMFLEDGDWKSADAYAEKVLDVEPTNARAYLGKLMAALCVKTDDDLKHVEDPFDNEPNYQKIMRFGDDALKAKLRAAIDFINARNEQDRQAEVFEKAATALESAETVAAVAEAKECFESIPSFAGVLEQLLACDERSEQINESNYQKAQALQAQGEYRKAIFAYRLTGTYKDAPAQIEQINEQINESTYQKAQALQAQGEYRKAIFAYGLTGTYKDASAQIELCKQGIAKHEREEKEQYLAERQAAEVAAAKENKRAPLRVCIFAFVMVAIVVAALIYTKVI